MSTEPEQSRSSSKSSKILVLGAIFWVIAIISLFVVWNNSNMPDNPENIVQTNDSDVSESDNEDEDDDDEGDGKPKTIVLKMFPFELMDFSLTERSGKTISKKDLLGKPWIVSFIFTRCAGPCYQITGQMAKLHKNLKDDDIRLVTITVDPKNDTPEVLKKYADAFQADPEKWLFLTGNQDKVYELISIGFKQIVKEDTSDTVKKGFEIAHSSNLMLINSKGSVLGKFNGQVDSEVAQLRKAAKKEVASLKEVK